MDQYQRVESNDWQTRVPPTTFQNGAGRQNGGTNGRPASNGKYAKLQPYSLEEFITGYLYSEKKRNYITIYINVLVQMYNQLKVSETLFAC